jgi:hypothetical protein
MFFRTINRTVLVAAFAAVLLVPAAQADDWAADARPGVDVAIATAIHDRLTLNPEPALDPALATAIREHASVKQEPLALDPAFRTALLERTTPPVRPDDRAGVRSVGSLPQPEVTTSEAFDWDVVGIGAGATFAALLLGLGSLLAVRRGRTRFTNAYLAA